jgi:hypothetical protein
VATAQQEPEKQPTPTPEQQRQVDKEKMTQQEHEKHQQEQMGQEKVGQQPGTQAEGEMPKPIKPAEETFALQPIAIDARWVGRVLPNAFKEGSPEMATKGNMDCSWTAGNLWLSCKLKETMGKGKEAMTWQGVMTVGYDYLNKEYRATMVDSMGGSQLLSGNLEGNKLVLTSMTTTKVNGEDCRGRISFDWTNPKEIKFTGENAKGAGDFKVTHEATLRPTKKEKLPGAPRVG